MANLRLFLKCKVCKERVYLMKYFPTTGWYIPVEFIELHDSIQKHNECQFDPSVEESMFCELFTLEYE